MGISDDGQRIVFSEDVGIFTIEADGSNRLQRTAGYVGTVLISGNGEKLVYGGSVVNWDGTGAVTLPGGDLQAGITDDGATIFYGGVWKVGSDGTGAVQILAEPVGGYYKALAVSGDGSRFAFYDGDYAVPTEPDLHVVNGSGAEHLQLTNFVVSGNATWVTLLPNASRLFFVSWSDLTGGNSQRRSQIYTILPNGTGLTQLTNFASWFNSYSVSDASVIVFMTGEDLLGTNWCHAPTIYRMNPGGPPVQVTFGCPSGVEGFNPQIRFDAQWIVFQSGSGVSLMKIKPDGTGLATIINDGDSFYKYPRLSASSVTTWIAYQSGENTDGLNPSGLPQILKITLDGTNRQRITSGADQSWYPDINLDGSKVVWISNGDLAGENPSHLNQVFFRDGTLPIRQISHDACIAWNPPRITRNGAWVYYLTCRGLLRTSVTSGVTERVQGFGNAIGPIYPYSAVDSYCPDSTGAKTALTGYDIIGRSPDSVSLFLADQTVKPKFNVGKASPTLLSWDPDPQSIRFDVLRGNIANLSRDATNVQLGAVACLEDDSPDNHTRGYGDAVDPAPGETFFFLYRGSVGANAAAGSYGQGTGDKERLANSGDCNP